ncbi:hypothetical protein [Methylobacterium sp. J-070]|uniref:hypothetical protein n=1 Tax=Methylobacterium sp. J-070 TaxID=2836650 RepID=UPI001FB881AA|nr:hypothetical protein [Methylobacterium sp. J-070]MCJ2054285.1 hypothetical protein [Methylobacterium sp. J-070]
MRVWLQAILALLVLPGGVARAETPRQLFLIQDSGWMEPFLAAEGSRFRPLIEALVAATAIGDGAVAIATFDQDGQVPGRTSPRILYDGPYRADRIRAAVTAIDLPRKAGGRAYADADFNGALLGGIRSGLHGRDGVIWMITNNKNAPGNSAEVERNTAAFYATLRAAPAFTRIVAHPVRMPLQGRSFSETGFVIYGIGYGPAGGRALDAVLAAPGLSALFSHPPVTLKPVPAGALALRFDRLDSGGLEAELENGVLVVRGADAVGGAVLHITGHLRNGLYPQRVAAARLALDWSEAQPGTALARARIVPDAIAELAPQAESPPLTVTLTLPPIPRPDGIAGLLAGSRHVDGLLTLRLTDLRLALDPAFLDRVRPIFGSGLFAVDQPTGSVAADPVALEDRLPGLFRDYRGVSEGAVSLPVRIEAAFSPWPLVAASGGGLALAGAAGLCAASMRRARTYTVRLGAVSKRASLRPYRPEVLRAPDGSRWLVRARLWGEPRVTRIAASGPGA